MGVVERGDGEMGRWGEGEKVKGKREKESI